MQKWAARAIWRQCSILDETLEAEPAGYGRIRYAAWRTNIGVEPIIVGILVPAALAVAGAYLYRRNRIWDRRGEAYAEILEALSELTLRMRQLLAGEVPESDEPHQSLRRVSQLLKSRISLVEEDVREAMLEHNNELTAINSSDLSPRENIQAVLDVTYRLSSVFSQAQERHTK